MIYCYDYDASGMRRHTVITNGQTLVKERTRFSSLYEEEATATTARRLDYIYAEGRIVAVNVEESGSGSLYYVLTDHLGSWEKVLTENKTVVQQTHFDPWGNRMSYTAWNTPQTQTSFMFDRGFTGHEHYDQLHIINANARLYDPVIGRFFSPDPFVQAPDFTQGFNRYSYCMNNPVMFADPTGWLLRKRVGGQGDNPPRYYYKEGEIWCNLPEVTIIADNHSLSNTIHDEFEYTPNLNGGGGSSQWSHSNSGSSNGHSGGGGGHGSGSHGIGEPSQQVNIEIPPNGVTIHSGVDLAFKAFWHYQFGKGKDYWVDASTINLDYISQADLKYYNGIATINLYNHIEAGECAFVLGKISLVPQGDNLFEIKPDLYDFNIEWRYGWSKRNIATAVSGLIHGPVIDNKPIPTHWMGGNPCYAQPSVYWGGPFYFKFSNYIYIKP